MQLHLSKLLWQLLSLEAAPPPPTPTKSWIPIWIPSFLQNKINFTMVDPKSTESLFPSDFEQCYSQSHTSVEARNGSAIWLVASAVTLKRFLESYSLSKGWSGFLTAKLKCSFFRRKQWRIQRGRELGRHTLLLQTISFSCNFREFFCQGASSSRMHSPLENPGYPTRKGPLENFAMDLPCCMNWLANCEL